MRDYLSDVSVVIVAHNSVATLPAALQALGAAGLPASRTMVVDVASTDGTAEYLEREMPGVRHVRLARNRGPNPARNRGIRECSTRWVFLMDADVLVEPDTIRVLREAVDEPLVAIGSAVVLHGDGSDLIQYSDVGLHFICEATNPYLDRPLAARGDDTRDVGVAPGGALLVERSAAIAVGLFDERYFMGKEDGEFAHRIRVAGYRIVEPPRARARHLGRRRDRDSRLFRYQIRNRWHVMLKNYQARTILCLLPVLALHEAVQAAMLIARGHGLSYVRAWIGLGKLLPALRADRAGVGSIRVRADRDLLQCGAIVARADFVGSPLARRAKRWYESWLAAYWAAVLPLLSRSGRDGETSQGQ